MNVYTRNFGMWLGAPLLAIYLIGYIFYFPLLDWLVLIGGTILGIVKTHQEIGDRINFGKAIGPILFMISAVFVFSLLLSMIQHGFPPMWYIIEFMIPTLLIKLFFATSILLATGTWYAFEKAGKPGWACIVPVYNMIILCEIANKPTWWVAMMFIPIANIVFFIMVLDSISKSFGKESGFTVGLVFLNQIFMAVLGFGPATYNAQQVNTTKSMDDLLDN